MEVKIITGEKMCIEFANSLTPASPFRRSALLICHLGVRSGPKRKFLECIFAVIIFLYC